jgi:hypothetical protein
MRSAGGKVLVVGTRSSYRFPPSQLHRRLRPLRNVHPRSSIAMLSNGKVEVSYVRHHVRPAVSGGLVSGTSSTAPPSQGLALEGSPYAHGQALFLAVQPPVALQILCRSVCSMRVEFLARRTLPTVDLVISRQGNTFLEGRSGPSLTYRKVRRHRFLPRHEPCTDGFPAVTDLCVWSFLRDALCQRLISSSADKETPSWKPPFE